MGKLLTALAISEDKQRTLPENVLMAEKIIIGFQGVYSTSPESPRKELLAKAISDAVFLMLEEIKSPMKNQQVKWYVGKSIKELDKIIIDMRRAVANVFPKGTTEGDSILAEATEIMNYQDSLNKKVVAPSTPPKNTTPLSQIPSTDSSVWGAEYNVGDNVKIRYDMAHLLKVENNFTITQKDAPNSYGMRPENPTGIIYQLSNGGGNWEGKDIEPIN